MEPLVSKVQKCMISLFDEAKFWAEVIGDCLGWTQSPYQWVFDQHEKDQESAKEKQRIQQERQKFYKVS